MQKDPILNENEKIQKFNFNDESYTILIEKKQNIYKFKIVDNFTHQVYECQQTQLKIVKIKTIQAAFNKNIQEVSYIIKTKEKDQIQIQFFVKLAYLLDQFSQKFSLKKLNQQKSKKVQVQILVKQINQTEELLNNYSQYIENPYTIIEQPLNRIQNKSALYSNSLQKGRYLIQCSGCVIISKSYEPQNQNFSQECDYDMQFMEFKYVQLNFKTKISSKNKIVGISSMVSDFSLQYQYPYAFTSLVQIDQKQLIQIVVEVVNIQSTLRFTNNIISLVKLIK